LILAKPNQVHVATAAATTTSRDDHIRQRVSTSRGRSTSTHWASILAYSPIPASALILAKPNQVHVATAASLPESNLPAHHTGYHQHSRYKAESQHDSFLIVIVILFQ
jgi:hypothetical protein